MRRITALCIITVALLPGCALLRSPTLDTPTKVDVLLYEALASIQDTEMVLRYPPPGGAVLIGDVDHKRISRGLADAFRALAAYNDALDVGNLVTVKEKVRAIRQIVTDLRPVFERAIPDAVARQRVLDAVDLALAIIAQYGGAA